MKRRIKSLEAFENTVGTGSLYIDPVPTFHPPSLKDNPKPKLNKLLQRLLKEQEAELFIFRNKLTRHQASPMLPMVTRALYDPSPIFVTPLFFSAKKNNK